MSRRPDLVGRAEAVAAAADRPAVTVQEERAKADLVLAGLTAERLLALPAPEDLGGAGASMLDVSRVVAAVSAVSGSAGLVCAMHFAQLFTLARHARGAHADKVVARVAASQSLVASGTSEVGVGGDILRSLCRIEPDGDGRRLTKAFANVSYLFEAGALLVTAMQREGRRERQRLVLLEPAQYRLSDVRETRLMGMRGIANRAAVLEAEFSPEAVLAEPFAVSARTLSAASHVLWSAVWCGLASSALARAQAISGRREGRGSVRLSGARSRLQAMNAMVRDACSAFAGPAHAGSPIELGTRFNTLKIVCAEMLGEVTGECAVVAGFEGYVEGGPNSLSEVLRDAFSARIMVSSDRLADANAAVATLVRDGI